MKKPAQFRSKTRRAARQKQGTGIRDGFAEALEEIWAKTRALSESRFEKLVTEAIAYARNRR